MERLSPPYPPRRLSPRPMVDAPQAHALEVMRHRVESSPCRRGWGAPPSGGGSEGPSGFAGDETNRRRKLSNSTSTLIWIVDGKRPRQHVAGALCHFHNVRRMLSHGPLESISYVGLAGIPLGVHHSDKSVHEVVCETESACLMPCSVGPQWFTRESLHHEFDTMRASSSSIRGP